MPVIPLQGGDILLSGPPVAGDPVQVNTVICEHTRPVDDHLAHVRVGTGRVPTGHRIDAMPPVREDDDTTIMPVVDEGNMVERRLILARKMRIWRIRISGHPPEAVMVRRQKAMITGTAAEAAIGKTTEAALGTYTTIFAQEQQR